MKEVYAYEFKTVYFNRLLLAGFNHSESIRNILSFDKSGFSEPLLSMEDYAYIDSLVVADNKQMVLDSLNSLTQRGEGAQGKRIFDYALLKYESKWLERIVRQRAKVYLREVKRKGDE